MENEIMPYKKKATKKPPKKSDHKHIFEPCVLEYNGERLDRGRGFVPERKTKMDSYCVVCGKRGVPDYKRWWNEVRGGCWVRFEESEEQLRELNPETRTLPTFWVDDYYKAKYVDLPEDKTEV